jgi:methylthioribose-1-phosphate isomerase
MIKLIELLNEVKLNEWRAEDVLQQLGGRKFIAMTGANNFVKDDKVKSITFKLPRAKSGIKYVRITLTSMDLYNVEFISARGSNIKTVATEKGVYNDQLQKIFTKHTGLYTSL